MTGSACASGRLKREQQHSKTLVHLARRYKIEYAERRQQEHAAKAACQQELASLQEALRPAANAANSPATSEPVALKPTEDSICITVTRPNMTVAKTKLEGEAENSTASPKIAAVKPAISVSSAAAPAEEQASVKTAGAATTTREMANASEVMSSEAGSMTLFDKSAQHKADRQLLQGSSTLAASLPLQHGKVRLVQHTAEVGSQSEGGDMCGASKQSAVLPVQARGENAEKQSGYAQQEVPYVEKDTGCAQQKMLHGGLPGRPDSPSLDVDQQQVSCPCQ